MITGTHPSTRPSSGGLRGLAAKPAARAGAVLVLLWIASAVILRASSDFGPMIAILAAASVVLGGYEIRGPGAVAQLLLGQVVLWGALIVATAVLLWESANLWPMVALFGIAAAWFVVAEPLLATRRGS